MNTEGVVRGMQDIGMGIPVSEDIVSANNTQQIEPSWGEIKEIIPCTYNQCSNNHTWPAQMVLINCPGCTSQVLVARMVQCPRCNEPTKQLVLRTDHTVSGPQISAACKNQFGIAEITQIIMERRHNKEIEEGTGDKQTTTSEA